MTTPCLVAEGDEIHAPMPEFLRNPEPPPSGGVIVALAGKKQSGKGTTCRLIERLNAGRRPVKEFFFAYLLKRMCVDILGLREEQAFGTDAEKNTIVPHLLWENFPVPVFDLPGGGVHVARAAVHECDDFRPYVDADSVAIRVLDAPEGAVPKAGPMTGREVLQYWGSEIFRRQYPTVWADATIRSVRSWLANNPGGVAVVTDTRFPDEVAAVREAGGRVCRLTRNPFDDRHQSETALDDYEGFDHVCDNAGLTVAETEEVIIPWLVAAGAVRYADACNFMEAA